jgi:hypothetical protein
MKQRATAFRLYDHGLPLRGPLTGFWKPGDVVRRILERSWRPFGSCIGSSNGIDQGMRSYTTKEKLKITAGAVTSLVTVGWLVVFAIAFLSAP